MSLSPEPVEIDTPPDSDSGWRSDSSSDGEAEMTVTSPLKRNRKVVSQLPSKRPRISTQVQSQRPATPVDATVGAELKETSEPEGMVCMLIYMLELTVDFGVLSSQ